MNNFTFGNATHQYYETICGGSGAGPGFDGTAAVHTHMTNSRLTDPEVLEWRYPVLLESHRINRGSGGQGRHRGGDGTIRRVRFLEPMQAALVSNRRKVPPFGLHGGEPGHPRRPVDRARRRQPRAAGRALPGGGGRGLTDPEVLEWRYPVLLESHRINRGSGGSGRNRGGDGTIRRVRFLEPMQAAAGSQPPQCGAVRSPWRRTWDLWQTSGCERTDGRREPRKGAAVRRCAQGTCLRCRRRAAGGMALA